MYRDGGKGSFVLDRRLGKLGRLKIASGTFDRDEFIALNGMISKLKQQRRWDLLELLTRRVISPLELMDARDRGELDELPMAEYLVPVKTTVVNWLKGADLTERTRDDYERRLEVARDKKIGDLPQFLVEARLKAIETGKRQTFDNLLMAVRALFRDTPKLTRLIAQLPKPFNVAHREGNPQEPDDIRALALKIPYPDELWGLCLTGMRQAEYWGTWTALSDRVQIAGVKGRRGIPLMRVVPLVYRPAAPRISYSTFYKALVRDSDRTLNCHDLRKTAQRWWEDAGIPDWRIRLYAGHSMGRGDMARIYRKPRDLSRLLREDAERIRAWIGDPPRAGLRVVGA